MAIDTTAETKAIARYIRMSPFKVRRVLDQIRGRSYREALIILEFMPLPSVRSNSQSLTLRCGKCRA